MPQIQHIENSVEEICVSHFWPNVDSVAIATVDVFQLLTSVEYGGKPWKPCHSLPFHFPHLMTSCLVYCPTAYDDNTVEPRLTDTPE